MIRILLASICFSLSLLMCPDASAGIGKPRLPNQFSGKVHLVAVGINDYSRSGTGVINLKSAEQDARNFSSRLKNDTAIKELAVNIFLSSAKKAEILSAFGQIAQDAMQNDVFIFYSASMSTDQGELLLADGSRLSAGELFYASQQILCTRQLFFIDACHGDLFIDQLRQKLTKNPQESSISNTNRIILAVKGLAYETSLGGFFTLSYTENPTLNLFDLFSLSDRDRVRFLGGFYAYTDSLSVPQKFECLFFSEAEFIQTAFQKQATRAITGITDEPAEGDRRVVHKGETLCLIIGTQQFKNFRTLPNAVSDAKSVKEIMDNQYRTKVIYLENPATNEFRKKLYEISNGYVFEPGSQFLFFAATHGAKDENGVGVMVFTDSYTEDGLLQNTYALGSIRKAVSQLPCTNSLMLLDICHSGTMFDDGSCNKTSAMEIPLDSPIFQSSGPQSPAFTNFLNQKTNLFISSSVDQEAADGKGEHSPFATVLLGFLKDNTLPVIDSYHLEQVIKNQVMKHGAISIPMFCTYACKDDGRFLFIRK